MMWLAQVNWRFDLVLPWIILTVGLLTFLTVLVARLLRADRAAPTPGVNQSESRWMLAIIFAFPAAAGAVLLVWVITFMWQASGRRVGPAPEEAPRTTIRTEGTNESGPSRGSEEDPDTSPAANDR